MSTTLYWKYVNKGKSLSDELKFALRKRCGLPGKTTLTNGDIDYLQGLKDAGLKDAGLLIEILRDSIMIEIWEES